MGYCVALVALLASSGAYAADNQAVVDSMIDVEHVRVWNRFADQVVALHQRQIAGRAVRVDERTGQYGGEMAKRYGFREASYYEADSGRLLSRVRWDRDRPEEVQLAEVYLYDSDGRVKRDYSFIYLPWGRGAPIRTFVSLHSHADGLHAIRQFDASGKPIYESCEGLLDGQSVEIALPEERLGAPSTGSESYRRCFAALPVVAGDALAPH